MIFDVSYGGNYYAIVDPQDGFADIALRRSRTLFARRRIDTQDLDGLNAARGFLHDDFDAG